VWLRLDKTPLWLVPGMASLALFASAVLIATESRSLRLR